MHKTISREELYKLIWARPIMDVAQEFGISDRGLGKICERYDIPKPPRGYWQRIKSGEKIKKPELPVTKNKYRNTITIQGSDPKEISQTIVNTLVEELSGVINVPDKISKLHSLVKETEKLFRIELRSRRNRILHTILSELEKRGYNIELSKEYFKIVFETEKIYLSVQEHYKTHKRSLTEKEEKEKHFANQKWAYEYQNTNKLKITVHEYEPDSYSRSVIKSFLDKNNNPLENQISEILLIIIETLLIKRERTIKRTEEERFRKEEEERQRILKKKSEILLQETSNWVAAENIRGYVQSKEKSYLGGKIEMFDFKEWKKFALEYADQIDSSLQDEKEIVDDYKDYRNWY